MDRFISYQRGRRSEWKGHESEKNVRNVLASAQREGVLHQTAVFELIVHDGSLSYEELSHAAFYARHPAE